MKVVVFDNPEISQGRSFKHLNICLEAARAYGNDPIIIQKSKSESTDRFKSVYRHSSINSENFTLFCFCRWFLLLDWMVQENENVVFHMDSDVILFNNVDAMWLDCPPGVYATNEIGNSFVTRNGLSMMTEWLYKIFHDGTEKIYSQTPGRASDMCNLRWLLIEKDNQPPLSRRKHGMVDPNIYIHEGHAFEEHKDILFINGIPYWNDGKGLWQLSSIHCWGKSKHRMPEIWVQSRISIGSHPVRMTLGD